MSQVRGRPGEASLPGLLLAYSCLLLRLLCLATSRRVAGPVFASCCGGVNALSSGNSVEWSGVGWGLVILVLVVVGIKVPLIIQGFLQVLVMLVFWILLFYFW